MFSLLFKGATVVDGSGNDSCKADVAVAGGRITAVEPSIAGPAAKVIDAGGLVLAPGFIDIHSHTDMTSFKYPGMESKAFQGVTVEVVGNCGLGLFPAVKERGKELADFLRMHAFHLPEGGITWDDVSSYTKRVERDGIALNLAPLVGHAPLRIAAMGMENREPTDCELGAMKRMLDEALRQGAWGMSTGLIYPPGSFARREELIQLARVLADRDALYASHIRNETVGLTAALEEAIDIGRASSVRAQVSHLKALGRTNWGRAGETLARVAAAREAGIDIAADQYPYDASATTLAAVVPQWAQEGGVARMIERLQNPELKARIAAEIGKEMAAREGAAGIMVTDCRSPQNRSCSGRTVAAIAEGWSCPPEEAVIRLVVEEQASAGAIFFSMREEDVEKIMADPQIAIGSDGHALDAALESEATHPRSYGTFTRVLSRYVREKAVLSLEGAVRKMTSLPASRLGFTDRGLVKAGFVADLVLFDPARTRDLSDYASPHRYSEGVEYLVVGGQLVIKKGSLTGDRPGKVLRR